MTLSKMNHRWERIFFKIIMSSSDTNKELWQWRGPVKSPNSMAQEVEGWDILWLAWGPTECPFQHSNPWIPNSWSEDSSTKADGDLEGLSHPDTEQKKHEQAHQQTAEGLAAPPPLPAFPTHSNFPLRAGCPFCVRCHSTRCLRWGPREVGPRIRWVRSPLWWAVGRRCHAGQGVKGKGGKKKNSKQITVSCFWERVRRSTTSVPFFLSHSCCPTLCALNPKRSPYWGWNQIMMWRLGPGSCSVFLLMA